MRRPSRPRSSILALLAIATFGPAGVLAHNVAVTHPQLTDESIRLLRVADFAANMEAGENFETTCKKCVYEELWQHKGGLLGPGGVTGDRGGVDVEDAGAYHTAFSGGNRNVILGSVIEDGEETFGPNLSALRVIHHFYHARSGVGLEGALSSNNRSSLSRAQELFLVALQVYDYDESSKGEAFHYLGRAMHHVEDMSSPSHVQNNTHLPAGADKDDYEGRYVPDELWRNHQLGRVAAGGVAASGRIGGATAPRTIDSADDIWSPALPAAQLLQIWGADDAALTGYISNRTAYQATLQFPASGSPANPIGELAEMFPNLPGPENGLYWDPGNLFEDPRWEIEDIGFYDHTFFSFGTNDWWPVGSNDAVETVETPDIPDGAPHDVATEYFLEQIMQGEDLASAVIPAGFRANYDAAWVDGAGNNDVAANTAPIVELQGDHLLAPAVEYAAGFGMWWHQIANTPPYLQKVELRQDPGDELRYLAEWTDTAVDTSLVLPEVNSGDTTIDYKEVSERSLTHDPDARKYVNNLGPLRIDLTFNEPVREVQELRIGTVDVLALVAGLSDPDNPSKQNGDATWIFTIPAANLVNLNGELTLAVRAIDMNDHWMTPGEPTCQTEGQLDRTPATPAKRRILGMPGPLPSEGILQGAAARTRFPWSSAADQPEFAYDCDLGDETHRLLFDVVDPAVGVGVSKDPIF